MTFRLPSRFARLAPSLALASFLLVSACATDPVRQPAPIETGQARPDTRPDRADRGVDEEGLDGIHEGEGITAAENVPEANPGYFTPEFMNGRDLFRIGVLLPFSHPNSGVREEAEGMLAGIEMALFDHGAENMLILPKDTAGSQSQTVSMAESALREGADVILGPLFGTNIAALNRQGVTSETQVIGFSNDSNVAGGNTWLASITPEEEVAALVDHAVSQGYRQFAYFGPQSDIGQRIETALQREATRVGGRVAATGFYPATTQSPDSEARYVANAVNSAQQSGSPVAILIPERGTQLRRVAPLLSYYGMSRRAQMMGLSGWDDTAVWREPSLRGGWFVAPPRDDVQAFNTKFQRIYGRGPSSLAATAYDAASLVTQLGADGEVTRDELASEDGFVGINGLFRFNGQGTTQRRLSVYEISGSDGAVEVRRAAESFDPGIS
ncbi:penicillin-binding protein activator [Henriciella marina]|uniref:penicillin-binding protein activator n=1 Tax=Henriciella marina TaxID=453851 RepID=UPI0003654F24|nr:penicillin-binding protein activator [Henriciella marina]